jgi:hypothetical protein
MTHLSSFDHRLPDLRFVPVETLEPHEQHDARRLDPLIQRLRHDAVLKNPPVVAPLGSDTGRFIVLDGANRVTAARTTGLPHIVVQVVRYEEPHVRLSTWSHALAEMPRAAFEATLRRIPGLAVREEPQPHARALLARREALAYAAYPDGRSDTLGGGDDIFQRNALLNAVVDTYREGQRYFRVPSDEFSDADERHPGITALVVFPHFEPAEVVELATTGARLPAGITRHLIRWRGLRLNVPIEQMADRSRTIADKNRWLEEWLRERLGQRQVRFYEEPTVSFDE